ncbi:calcium-binding protein [Methylobacterium sp. 88A]|uniref:calcium-binding protein n=1 Tax=Methylobacterium sp. 88A TaxID=1131813 RepID=UPI000382328F|nr:calcium-binding protein [Methylobacterium sp. 88A]
MATYSVYDKVDFRTLDIWQLDKTGGLYYDTGPTGYELDFNDRTAILVQGHDLTYARNGDPTSGTTTALDYDDGAGLYSTLRGIDVTVAHEKTFFDHNDTQYVLKDIFAGNDTINGSRYSDYIDGYTGADTMKGGDGDDVYIVDNSGDRVIERSLNGVDLVKSSVSFSIGGQFIENLTLTGTSAINGTGNTGDNVLTGNAAANTLKGGAGDDALIGGRGRDVLLGGAGDDTFQFKSIRDSAAGAEHRDQISDFTIGADHIDLHLIQAVTGATGDQPFSFIGDAAFSKQAGQLHALVSGSATIVEGDVNGDGKADFQISLKNVVETLHASDFLL